MEQLPLSQKEIHDKERAQRLIEWFTPERIPTHPIQLSSYEYMAFPIKTIEAQIAIINYARPSSAGFKAAANRLLRIKKHLQNA